MPPFDSKCNWVNRFTLFYELVNGLNTWVSTKWQFQNVLCNMWKKRSNYDCLFFVSATLLFDSTASFDFMESKSRFTQSCFFRIFHWTQTTVMLAICFANRKPEDKLHMSLSCLLGLIAVGEIYYTVFCSENSTQPKELIHSFGWDY